MKFNYNDGGRGAAGFKGDTRDCVARSIAIVTGKPYSEIYNRLAEGNANQRQGKYHRKSTGSKTAAHGIQTKRKWFEDYMKELGFSWVPTMQIGQGCKVHLRNDELPMGKLVVNVSKHFTAVIDGVINDTHDCSREGMRCVYGYYIYNQLTKEQQRIQDLEQAILRFKAHTEEYGGNYTQEEFWKMINLVTVDRPYFPPVTYHDDFKGKECSSDPRDNPLIGEDDSWVHDVDMGAR